MASNYFSELTPRALSYLIQILSHIKVCLATANGDTQLQVTEIHVICEKQVPTYISVFQDSGHILQNYFNLPVSSYPLQVWYIRGYTGANKNTKCLL